MNYRHATQHTHNWFGQETECDDVHEFQLEADLDAMEAQADWTNDNKEE